MKSGNTVELKNVFAVPNTTAGVKIINELLKARVEVFWLTQEFSAVGKKFGIGTFLVNETPTKILEGIVQKYPVAVYRMPEEFEAKCCKVRLPKVALYDGQGVDGMNARFRADAEYALQLLEFPFGLVAEDDVKQGLLNDFDALLIPAGDASEIMHGWNIEFGWNKAPWQLPGSPKGLGEKGIAAIKEFIQEGGGYIGVSSGGGALACKEVGSIANVSMRKFESKAKTYSYAAGHTRVYLRICEKNSPVVYGYKGYYDLQGKWREEQIPAYYLSDPLVLTYGGPIFEVGNGVKVLATYHDVDSEEWTGLFPNPDPFNKDFPAIVEQKIGKGVVILFGVDLFYGKSWLSTYRLVSNSLYYMVSSETVKAIGS
jgi:glutamine amidotransferase-like uncharacterized protein